MLLKLADVWIHWVKKLIKLELKLNNNKNGYKSKLRNFILSFCLQKEDSNNLLNNQINNLKVGFNCFKHRKLWYKDALISQDNVVVLAQKAFIMVQRWYKLGTIVHASCFVVVQIINTGLEKVKIYFNIYQHKFYFKNER